MLGWKTIDQLIAEECKTMVYKSLHEMAPLYRSDFLRINSTSSSYVLRNTVTDLKLPREMSYNRQICFSYRGAKMWNDLHAKTKQASSLAVFSFVIKAATLSSIIDSRPADKRSSYNLNSMEYSESIYINVATRNLLGQVPN